LPILIGMRLFQNGVLRRISVFYRDEMTEGRREASNEGPDS